MPKETFDQQMERLRKLWEGERVNEAGRYAILSLLARYAATQAPCRCDPPGSGEEPEVGRMIPISQLIAELQAIQERFGDTCTYITGLSWGAVALNRRSRDRREQAEGVTTADQEAELRQARLDLERLRGERNRQGLALRQAVTQARDAERAERAALAGAKAKALEEKACAYATTVFESLHTERMADEAIGQAGVLRGLQNAIEARGGQAGE